MYSTSMNKGTYRKANIALVLSFIGLAVSFPFRASFLGGLLTSGFSAALVGGLADWFAVNALFRRPLGVPPGKIFRTEIIPCNRERIYQALADMVQEELLSKEALKTKLTNYDFVTPLIRTWEASGAQTLISPLAIFLNHLYLKVYQEIKKIQKLYDQKEQNELNELGSDQELDFSVFYIYIGQTLKYFAKTKEGEKAVEEFLKTLGTWVNTSEAHNWLTNWLDNAITRYINGSTSRKFLTMFLPEPKDLATNLQEQINDFLLEDSTKQKVQNWLIEKAEEIILDPESPSAKLLDKAIKSIAFNNLVKYLEDYLEENNENKMNQTEALVNITNTQLEKLKSSLEKRKNLNTNIQNLLIPLIESQHKKIGSFVREGLDPYTDEMLVNLIESKAGNDLQMIRINGSLVGGLVGILLYTLNGLIFGGI